MRADDGNLSVTAFVSAASTDSPPMIFPERAYRDENDKKCYTHMLREEDLLRMSELLRKAYTHLRCTTQEFEPK